MTKPRTDVREIVEKWGEADLLLEMIGFAAERLMELEVGSRMGATKGCVLLDHSRGPFDDCGCT